jgi:hypothetical protein
VTWNLCRNRKHRRATPMAIEEAIDKVQIARAATARAHGNFSCKVSLRAGGKCGHLFMPYMQPFDLFTFSDYLGQAIQRITNHSVDPLYACVHQCFDEYLSHSLCHAFPHLGVNRIEVAIRWLAWFSIGERRTFFRDAEGADQQTAPGAGATQRSSANGVAGAQPNL